MRKRCILLTGGAGFLGCEIAGLLYATDAPVIAVDNLSPQVHPAQERPAMLPSSVCLKIADICDPAFWAGFCAEYDPEHIIHLAAETGTAQSLTESARHASVNVTGTATMLDALAKSGQRPRHIVLASSRAVYGEGAWRSTETGALVYPRQRCHAKLARGEWSFKSAEGLELVPVPHCAANVAPSPSSIYGATKLAQEHILSAWTGAMGVALTILRLQNVYGPGQSPHNPYTGVINIFHRQARMGHAIDVFEDGRIGRDFIFCPDAAQAFVRVLWQSEPAQRVLDVGTGSAITIHEAAQIIAEMHGAPPPRVSGQFRDGDVRWAVADATALRQEAGVHPRVPFAEGARKTGEWLMEKGFI